MKWAGFLILAAGLWAAPALAKPANVDALACATADEAACMLDAAWTAALLLPPEKLDRVKPLFASLVVTLPGAARARWTQRTGDAGPEKPSPDYLRQTAETAIRDHGWDGFVERARSGAAPLHMGRPEIMAAAIDLAPDAAKRAQLIELMFALAGPSKPGRVGGFSDDDFERADFGHVLAERMMRDCRLSGFDRAVALTNAPDALRYRLWRARITGGAGALAPDIREGDGTEDTRHVRQVLEGYSPILTLGYCGK
jgi:hypothetical protein